MKEIDVLETITVKAWHANFSSNQRNCRIECTQVIIHLFIIYSYKSSGFTSLFAGQFNTEDYSAFTDVE